MHKPPRVSRRTSGAAFSLQKDSNIGKSSARMGRMGNLGYHLSFVGISSAQIESISWHLVGMAILSTQGMTGVWACLRLCVKLAGAMQSITACDKLPGREPFQDPG